MAVDHRWCHHPKLRSYSFCVWTTFPYLTKLPSARAGNKRYVTGRCWKMYCRECLCEHSHGCLLQWERNILPLVPCCIFRTDYMSTYIVEHWLGCRQQEHGSISLYRSSLTDDTIGLNERPDRSLDQYHEPRILRLFSMPDIAFQPRF